MSSGESEARALNLATWGDRILAYVIDVLIIGAVLGAIRSALLVPGTFGNTLPPYIPWSSAGFDGVIYLTYFTLTDYAHGRSLGKALMRLRVTGLRGQRISLGQSLIESFGKAFFPLNFFDLLLGFTLLSSRQRLFSYLAGTIVTKSIGPFESSNVKEDSHLIFYPGSSSCQQSLS